MFKIKTAMEKIKKIYKNLFTNNNMGNKKSSTLSIDETSIGIKNNEMVLVSHRGNNSLKTPENTLAAFRQTIRDGINYIELDLQLTLDKEVIVSHDILHKDTGLYQLVCDFEYRDELLFDTVLRTLPNNINFIIDLKDNRPKSKLVLKVLDICNKYRSQKSFDKYIFASFNEFHLEDLLHYEIKHNIFLKKAYITSNLELDFFRDKIKKWRLNYLILYKYQANYEVIDKLKRYFNIKVFLYTCNTIEEIDYAKNIDVYGVISDNAYKFINL